MYSFIAENIVKCQKWLMNEVGRLDLEYVSRTAGVLEWECVRVRYTHWKGWVVSSCPKTFFDKRKKKHRYASMIGVFFSSEKQTIFFHILIENGFIFILV